MADERDEIRRRIDIVGLIGREIPLKRAGKSFKGLCPFHADKNPSFTVSPETGRYKCWSCGESGDIFTWVMKRRNVEFGEALDILAKEAGVLLTARGPTTSPSVRSMHESAMQEAVRFFREQFLRSETARAYCEGRRLDAETLDMWEIGYAPDVGEALAVHLKKKGFPLVECKALFLVDEDSRGGYFDKFRGRLIFPIRDEKGELVAFGGRILGAGHPKYINSSDTPLYRKSRVLYGMHRGRDRISKERRAILVEGYLDVIACHAAGMTSAVASLGTALSEDHARLLKRWSDEVIILYDSDEAGQKASARAVPILEAEGIRVRVALMPEGEDPDTLLKNEGPGGITRAVEAALSPLDYSMQALRRRLKPDQEEFWTEAFAILAKAPSEIEAAKHIDAIASLYPGLRDPLQARTAIRKDVARVRRLMKPNSAGDYAATAKPAAAPKVPLSSAEFVVFRAFMDDTLRVSGWMHARREDLFVTETGVTLSRAVSASFPAPPEGHPATWLHRIQPEELRQTLSDLLHDFRSENMSEERLADSVTQLTKQFQKRQLRERRGEDVNALQKSLLRLRELNPDTTAVQKQDDDLF